MGVPPKGLAKVPGSIQEAAAAKAAGKTTETAPVGSTGYKVAVAPEEEVKGGKTILRSDAQNAPELTPEKKRAWNLFIKYMHQTGWAGKDELDTGDVGNKLFEKFRKENPKVAAIISKADMPSIRKAFAAKRDKMVSDFVAGKQPFYDSDTKQFHKGKKGDYTNFLRHTQENENAKDPNYIGKQFSQTGFYNEPGVISKKSREQKKAHEGFKAGTTTAIDMIDDEGNYIPAEPYKENEQLETVITKNPPKEQSSGSKGASLIISNFK
jgi:hypothetical protein